MNRIIMIPLLLIVTGAGAPAAPDAENERVIRSITLSKTTTITYSNYMWNRISLPGGPPVEEWSAEFNSGSKHRIETPRDRVIADCAAMTGSSLSLPSGEVKTGRAVAAGACGINTDHPFVAGRHLGRVNGRYGAADRVELTDEDVIRTYDVSDEGILLRTVYSNKDAKQTPVIENETVALERHLPGEDIFSEASLSTSAVPERFKKPPPRN
jgi:hypothetical protein